jgi:hypothetical protein
MRGAKRRDVLGVPFYQSARASPPAGSAKAAVRSWKNAAIISTDVRRTRKPGGFELRGPGAKRARCFRNEEESNRFDVNF